MKLSMILAAAVLAASTLSASAVTFATDVDWANNGTVPGDRDNPADALGAPDGKFLSLGLTNADGTNPGFAVFTFGTPIVGTNAASVFEVTFVCNGGGGVCTNHVEEVELLVGTAGEYDFGSHDFSDLSDFTSVGFLDNGDAQTGASIIISGSFTYLALVDRSVAAANLLGIGVANQSRDGFDVDSVSVEAVPIPTSVALMLTALGGLGFMAARRRAV